MKGVIPQQQNVARKTVDKNCRGAINPVLRATFNTLEWGIFSRDRAG